MSVNADLFSTFTGQGACGVISGDFTVELSDVLGIDAVFTITSSAIGDTIVSSPVTIVSGDTFGTFDIIPTTCGSRTITMSSSTVGVVITTPTCDYIAVCACPDNAGATNETAFFGLGSIGCPPSFSASFSISSVSSVAGFDALYCSVNPTVVITE